MTALPKQTIYDDPGAAQRAASDPRASVWVNASAGSGKTTVLTSRVLRLLLADTSPQKILCLTYTRAGAAEMANRVTARLSAWAVCTDNRLNEELSDLQGRAPLPREMRKARQLFVEILGCPGGLRIRTIHSFCQEILSRFPIEAGLPPYFALIDEAELDAMRQETLDELLDEANKNPDGDLAGALHLLVSAQGEKTFESMLNEVIQLRGRLTEAAQGGEAQLIARLRDFLQLGHEDTADSFRQRILRDMPRDELQRLVTCLAEGTPTYQKRGAALQKILASGCEAGLFGPYCKAFLTDKNEPYKSFADKKLATKYPEIDEICAREAARLCSALERIEAAEIAERTASTLHFGLRFADRLAQRKAARAVLDYDDLILLTEKLLSRPGIAPWILYKLDNGIDHILVDEAQDTSRAQWRIVEQLTAEFFAGAGARDKTERTLFVVGDEKQSIFSFQNADPESFLSLRDFFAQQAAQAGKKLDRIPLRTSFRSSASILDAVDAVFASDKARQGVSIEPVTHRAFKSMPGRVEIWPLLVPVKDETDDGGDWPMPTGYEEAHDPEGELAQQIARKISQLIAQKEATAGDIMILLRRRGSFADKMVRALKAQRIPVTGVDRMRLMDQLPVMDLLALVRFVLLPEDDLNLASLLRSPLLGLSEEELMTLAIEREGSLWQAVQNKADRFGAARDYLAARLGEADFSTPFAFLSNILNMPCPGNKISGRQAIWSRLGEESLDPIEELLNKAQHFTRMREPSLQNFLHWLTQTDAEIKRELDRGQGQVRIMTVHASKGLEAPIVFLPDKAELPQSQKLSKFQFAGNDLPLFLSRQPQWGAAREVWQRARDRQMEEYRRLFYVALTRAEKRLYICGWLGGKASAPPADSWYALASEALAPLHKPELAASNDIRPDIVTGDAELAPPISTAPKQISSAALPHWATQALSSVPQAPSLAPSQISLDTSAATPDYAFKRGRIIHRLLQSIPSVTATKRADATVRYLASPQHDLTEAQRAEISGEVLKLLADPIFADLFAPDSLAEAPVSGQLGGKPVFRQIDRLVRRGNDILIVDYKTNRPPPRDAKDIPESYRQQLGEYRALMTQVWPDSRIRCFLLWTYTAQLMEVDF